MDKPQVPAQPGSPKQARRWLPLGRLGIVLLGGMLFCILATFGFVWLAGAIFADRFVVIDDAVLTWAHNYWGPTLNQVMLFFTTMGSMVVLAVFVTLIAFALLRSGRWIDAIGLIVASAGAGLLNQVLKTIFQRVRPDLFSGPFYLTSYSFPSGHSMGSLACYGMMAFIGARLLRRRGQRILLILGAALLILCIGFSRIYFDVHYPTDVLGGFTAGAIWLVITIILVQIAEWYALRRTAHLSQASSAEQISST
jgi:undecaprenyl-diphosphatase